MLRRRSGSRRGKTVPRRVRWRPRRRLG